MTWDQTHQRYLALREIETELDRAGTGQLPWQPRYAEIFGNQHGLLLALRHRWALMVQTQLDDQYFDADELAIARHELAAEHPGLLRALERHSRAVESPSPAVRPRPRCTQSVSSAHRLTGLGVEDRDVLAGAMGRR